MCGLAGIVSPSSFVREADLELMIKKIEHRGPDGTGYWRDAHSRVMMAHNRLAIVDLNENANQPMCLGDQFILVFNGEIYNHRQLRRELEIDGEEFVTDHSDTEVLLRACARWGVSAALKRIEGMFAFAFYDVQGGTLTLARDRFGEKPLFYSVHGETLYFASEIKSLLATENIPVELNRDAVVDYLSFRTCPAPNTFYKSIYKVKAGHFIQFRVSDLYSSETCYWDLLSVPIAQNLDLESYEVQVGHILRRSMASMVDVDVPLGLFLSGGVDSTLILGLLSEQVRPELLSGFNVSYKGTSANNETEKARFAADTVGANLLEVVLDLESFKEDLANLHRILDEPLGAPVSLPVLALSQAAKKQGKKVVFCGDGADEIFLGYAAWCDNVELTRRLEIGSAYKNRLMYEIRNFIKPSQAHHNAVYLRASRQQPTFWSGVEELAPQVKRKVLHSSYQRNSADTYERVVEPLWRDFKGSRYAAQHFKWTTYMESKIRYESC